MVYKLTTWHLLIIEGKLLPNSLYDLQHHVIVVNLKQVLVSGPRGNCYQLIVVYLMSDTDHVRLYS